MIHDGRGVRDRSCLRSSLLACFRVLAILNKKRRAAVRNKGAFRVARDGARGLSKRRSAAGPTEISTACARQLTHLASPTFSKILKTS